MPKDAQNICKHASLYASDAVLSRECFGKVRLTAAEAKSKARKFRDGTIEIIGGRPIIDGWCIYAYRCRVCSFWHIGHNPQKALALKTQGPHPMKGSS